MAQDFLGSIAQEDVQFITEVLRVTNPGDNYWRTMFFIEEARFVRDPDAFVLIPGTGFKVATVTRDDYSQVARGLLQSWLYDLFCSNNVNFAYLVIAGEDVAGDTADFIEGMTNAYHALKDYAYWKIACAGSDTALNPAIAVALSLLAAEDRDLLSGAIPLPYTTATPEDPTTDPLYDAFVNGTVDVTKHHAFWTAYQDPTRNASLFRIGQALGRLNNSGTSVGNNFDYWATGLIACSGVDGTNLGRSVRVLLQSLYIAYFKPVGDATGNVAAIGVQDMNRDFIQARWIVNYIQFMCKVRVANYITRPNVLRNAQTYEVILGILSRELGRFGIMGSGRLENIIITAPAFNKLPVSKGDEIIIPNAWAADFTDQVRTVRVFGTLTISS